jgi:hypothetical protein
VRRTTNISLSRVSINATLAFGPSRVISLPLTKITQSEKDFSITRTNSSRAPVTDTIGVEVGITTTVWDGEAETVICPNSMADS